MPSKERSTTRNRRSNRPVSDASPTIDDVLPSLRTWPERITRFHSYLRTRHAVLTGVQLWNWSKADLSTRHYMDPWTFRIYQCALTSLPSVVLGAVLSFLGIRMQEQPLQGTAFDELFFKNFERFDASLMPLLIPLTLTIASVGAAYGSLEPGDRSKERKSRARRAYLYFDGAHGAWTQALMIACLVTYESPLRDGMGPVLLLLGWLVFLAGMFWQYRVSLWMIPKELFAVNGYDREYPAVGFWLRRGANDASWRRYRLWTVPCGSLAGHVVFFTLLAVALAGAYGFTHLQLYVRSLIGNGA